MKQTYYLISLILLLSIIYRTPTICYGQVYDDQMAKVAKSLDLLKEKEADFLAPKRFKAVEEAYAKYIDAVRDSKSEREIDQLYTAFSKTLIEANDQVMQTNNLLLKPLEMRALAILEKANTLAEKPFKTAELRLSKAISKLEDGKVVDATSIGNESLTLFRVSRISAVKARLIGSAQAGITEAKEKKWDQLAPLSFKQASIYLNEVVETLERGEEVTDDLQIKAQQGNYETRHALWLAAKIDSLRRNPGNWESLLLAQENMVRQATHLVGLEPDFIVDSPERILSESLSRMTGRIDSLNRDSARKDQYIIRLQITVDSLNTAISQQQIRLASMVENYQRDLQSRKEDLELKRRELNVDLRKKIQLDAVAQAQARFLPKEAIVLREEKDVIIRLVGLEFKAGITAISQKGTMILDKMGDFLSLYPETTVVVEGHTDTSGKSDKNLALSEERASTVKGYLLTKSGLRADQITSKGFGSLHPIANNKTRGGREQNRRIDIVISFESES